MSHIGDYGIFAEYTKHDISHIDEMLRMVEWIIPEKTKSLMTPAEWTMLVLSIYFHDMGMLISKNEFKTRIEQIQNNAQNCSHQKNVFESLFCLCTKINSGCFLCGFSNLLIHSRIHKNPIISFS